MHAYNVPARDHVDGGEVLEDYAGRRPHVEGVDLDEVTGAV